MSIAYIGIGTNIGERKDNILAALDAINLIPNTKVLSVSKIYETEPWGYLDQDKFLNAAAKVETSFDSKMFLGMLLGIEAAMGRVRSIKNGPRVIDLDLLYFDDEVSTDPNCILPHPRIMERAFVLKPLSDINDSKEILSTLKELDLVGIETYKY